MQWEAGPGAVFTTGTPWIRVDDNCAEINAAAEQIPPYGAAVYRID